MVSRDHKSLLGWLLITVCCLGLLVFFGMFTTGLLMLQKTQHMAVQMTASASPLNFTAPAPTQIKLPSPVGIHTSSPTPARVSTATPIPTDTPEQPAATQTLTSTVSSEVFIPGGWCVPWNSPSRKAQVIKVIDGITFEASIDNSIFAVRYIGLDLLQYTDNPEQWSRMTENNRSLVEGKTVLLIEGTQPDLEEPLLRYVLLDGQFINLELVQSGYAAEKIEPGNTCQLAFSNARIDAQKAGRGLWAATATPTRTLIPPSATVSPFGDVVVVNISKRGNGWQEPEEYVEIFNSGAEPVQLKGWSLSDIDNHVFWFPRFILGPGQYCRVYTNQYWPKHCGFTYQNPAPIWDNTGDCAYLRDATGRLVNKFCYD